MTENPVSNKAQELALRVVEEFARRFSNRLFQVRTTGNAREQSPLMLTLAAMRQNFLAQVIEWGIDDMDAYEIWFAAVEGHSLARWAIVDLPQKDDRPSAPLAPYLV